MISHKNIFFSLICLIIFFQCKEELKQKEKIVYTVKVEKVSPQTIQSSIELFGEIKSEGKHDHSFLIDGKLISINVKEGQKVRKGTILAKLDRHDYQEAVKIAKAKLDEANDQFERLSKMYEAGSLAEADYNKILYLQKEAEANYTLYKNKLNYTTLRAAVDGEVSKVWVKNGGGISKGEPIVRVINTSTVYASVGVPENKVNKIDLEKECTVIIDATGDKIDGKIANLHPSASKLTRTFQLDVLLKNTDNLYKDGMLCQVKVYEGNSEEKITIPINLIQKDIDGLKYVFLKRKDIAHKQRVITGKINGNNIIIEKGIYNGDELILNPPLKLMDGSAVKL